MRNTEKFYNINAEQFYTETIGLDMSELYKPFLDLLPDGASILDAGCGSGRDSKNFKSRGYKVTSFDSSADLCGLASKAIDQKVLNLEFKDINFENQFNGIWACASLLHLTKPEITDAFIKLSNALKKNGVIYCSFKYGDFEGERNGRYFTDLTYDSLLSVLAETKLKVVHNWLTNDIRVGRENDKWLNALVKADF